MSLLRTAWCFMFGLLRHAANRRALSPIIIAAVVDLTPATGDRAHPRCLGSSASRTASPTKISSDNISATRMKPDNPSHGASRYFLPWSSSSPSEGDRVRRNWHPLRRKGGHLLCAARLANAPGPAGQPAIGDGCQQGIGTRGHLSPLISNRA